MGVNSENHRLLAKQRTDREFERRSSRQDLALLAMLLPLLVFVGLTYREIGFVPPVALSCAAATYAVVLLLCTWRGRRSILDDLRREGLAEDVYRPPPD